MDRDGWKALVDQMANNGANATSAEFDTITTYLATVFPATPAGGAAAAPAGAAADPAAAPAAGAAADPAAAAAPGASAATNDATGTVTPQQ
jgi:hypothetical protein